jgi:PAS domain S-box-containing protein
MSFWELRGLQGAERLRNFREAFSYRRWTLRTRVVALVVALAVPLNLLAIGAIWQLAGAAGETQRTGLLYTARTVASAVDAHISKFISLAQSLANSPSLLHDDLGAFKEEALRAFPQTGDAWLLVANLEGRQLFNSAMAPGQSLPQRNPGAIAAQRQALAQRTVVVADRIVFGPLTQSWVATIEVPVFKEGMPYRVLAVAMKMQGFQRLLSEHQMPQGWLAGLIDAEGRFLARVPRPETYIGQLASEGWRRIKDQVGVFESRSLEGTLVVNSNTHPSLAPRWAISIAVPQSDLKAAAWSTVRWTALLGAILSCLSLALAVLMARRIEAPVTALREDAARIVAGSAPSFRAGLPEIQALVDALQSAATDRKRGEEASQRLAAIVRSSFDAIISKMLDGTITSWNAGAEKMFGYTANEMIGQSIRRLIPQDRQMEEDNILSKVAANQRVEPFETVRLRKDGSLIPVSVTISPVTDVQGRVTGASKVARDISEQKRREGQVQLLLSELNHRSKNVLAVVQSIAHRTAVSNPSDFIERFSQRLGALAVNQDLLAKNEWHGIDLEELLHAQLAPFAQESRVRTAGPAIRLSTSAAQAIGMAVHELATNASKYGAWSTDSGAVEVSWQNDADALTLRWIEIGGPPVKPPSTRGFGSMVTSMIVEQAVHGKVEISYASTGVTWVLTGPLNRILDGHG